MKSKATLVEGRGVRTCTIYYFSLAGQRGDSLIAVIAFTKGCGPFLFFLNFGSGVLPSQYRANSTAMKTGFDPDREQRIPSFPSTTDCFPGHPGHSAQPSRPVPASPLRCLAITSGSFPLHIAVFFSGNSLFLPTLAPFCR